MTLTLPFCTSQQGHNSGALQLGSALGTLVAGGELRPVSRMVEMWHKWNRYRPDRSAVEHFIEATDASKEATWERGVTRKEEGWEIWAMLVPGGGKAARIWEQKAE